MDGNYFLNLKFLFSEFFLNYRHVYFVDYIQHALLLIETKLKAELYNKFFNILRDYVRFGRNVIGHNVLAHIVVE